MDDSDNFDYAYEGVTIEDLLEASIENGYQHTAANGLAYHNTDHLKTMEDYFYFICGEAARSGSFWRVWYNPRQKLILRLAIAWHDAVYEVGVAMGENEAASAELFEQTFTELDHQHFPELQSYIDNVKKLILVTGKHFTDYRPTHDIEAVMMDLDLITFSWDFHRFYDVNVLLDKEALTKFSYNETQEGRLRFFYMVRDNFRFFALPQSYTKTAKQNIDTYIKILER